MFLPSYREVYICAIMHAFNGMDGQGEVGACTILLANIKTNSFCEYLYNVQILDEKHKRPHVPKNCRAASGRRFVKSSIILCWEPMNSS